MSERETELDKLLNDIEGKHSKRANAILVTMEDDDFMVAYFKAIEYKKPKLQRQEISGQLSVNKVIVEHVSVSLDDGAIDITPKDLSLESIKKLLEK